MPFQAPAAYILPLAAPVAAPVISPANRPLLAARA
jgi:hypothetical protein